MSNVNWPSGWPKNKTSEETFNGALSSDNNDKCLGLISDHGFELQNVIGDGYCGYWASMHATKMGMKGVKQLAEYAFENKYELKNIEIEAIADFLAKQNIVVISMHDHDCKYVVHRWPDIDTKYEFIILRHTGDVDYDWTGLDLHGHYKYLTKDKESLFKWEDLPDVVKHDVEHHKQWDGSVFDTTWHDRKGCWLPRGYDVHNMFSNDPAQSLLKSVYSSLNYSASEKKYPYLKKPIELQKPIQDEELLPHYNEMDKYSKINILFHTESPDTSKSKCKWIPKIPVTQTNANIFNYVLVTRTPTYFHPISKKSIISGRRKAKFLWGDLPMSIKRDILHNFSDFDGSVYDKPPSNSICNVEFHDSEFNSYSVLSRDSAIISAINLDNRSRHLPLIELHSYEKEQINVVTVEQNTDECVVNLEDEQRGHGYVVVIKDIRAHYHSVLRIKDNKTVFSYEEIQKMFKRPLLPACLSGIPDLTTVHKLKHETVIEAAEGNHDGGMLEDLQHMLIDTRSDDDDDLDKLTMDEVIRFFEGSEEDYNTINPIFIINHRGQCYRYSRDLNADSLCILIYAEQDTWKYIKIGTKTILRFADVPSKFKQFPKYSTPPRWLPPPASSPPSSPASSAASSRAASPARRAPPPKQPRMVNDALFIDQRHNPFATSRRGKSVGPYVFWDR